ncbi:MAG: cupin-like domain-containing protein [Hyphomonas sp.]|nr:cupin-like domain-containing protein [Hyphomonas sp.]
MSQAAIDQGLPHVTVLEGVPPEEFNRQVRMAGRPVLLRNLVSDWPIVGAAQSSVASAVGYLQQLDNGKPVHTVFGAPEIQGRFFYSDDLSGLNFHKREVPLSAALSGLLSQLSVATPGSIYIQSIPVDEHIPGFEQAHTLPYLDPAITPRIWIGNQITVQTHFDLYENIACLAAGRRRFTFFPPDQIANLYAGPFEHTLSGPPVSMVRLEDIDFEAYPRFRDAMAHAIIADLEPGDAVYIPYGWWHHVQSLERFNILVNYWWNDAPGVQGSPFDAMLHGLLAIRDLPADARKAWKHLFDQYVFLENGDPVAHLPAETRGALGQHSEAQRQMLWQMLSQSVGHTAAAQARKRQPD